MTIEDQPPPIANDRPAVWELVIAEMKERDHTGRARYGVPLQPFNGRASLVDAYQEALDLVVYLRQRIEEDLVTARDVAAELRAAEARGMRRGFELAQEHADISTHDGWQPTNPTVDWYYAEKMLAEALREFETGAR